MADDNEDYGESSQYSQGSYEEQGYGQTAESEIELESLFLTPQTRSDWLEEVKKKKLLRKKLPITNFFTRDKTTSNFDGKDYTLASRYNILCSLLKFEIIVSGKGDSGFSHNLYNDILNGKCSIAKSKGGWSNLMVRSKFAEYKALETVIDRGLAEEAKKPGGVKGMLGGFPFRKNPTQ